MVNIDIINKGNLILGRMPKKENEIVLDKMALEKILNTDFNRAKSVGIKTVEDFLNREISLYSLYVQQPSIKMDDFKLVGICDNGTPSVYMDEDIFINVLASSTKGDPYSNYIVLGSTEENNSLSHQIYDIELAKDKIELTEGRMPKNDYEIIVNETNEYEMDLYETIKDKINDKELKVVGYYTSKEEINDFFTTSNTIKYKLLQENNNITIYPKDKQKTIDYFNKQGKYIEDTYERDRKIYVDSIKNSITSSIILASVILAVSLIEIFLMMRSSFLSRVKEVGILRAIALKKKDIYKMFLGEIIALTIVTAIPGLLIMTNILKGLQLIPYYQDQFMLNFNVILISIIIIVVFNIIVGLLPVFNVIRKTPAQILSRNDVD